MSLTKADTLSKKLDDAFVLPSSQAVLLTIIQLPLAPPRPSTATPAPTRRLRDDERAKVHGKRIIAARPSLLFFSFIKKRVSKKYLAPPTCFATMLRTVIAFAALAMAAVMATDPYTVTTKEPGAFTIDNITMVAKDGKSHWDERVVAVITQSGICNKTLTAGTVKYQVYETGIPSFTSQGDFSYFHCDNTGCDRTQPMALKLDKPNGVPTKYTATFEFQMPYKKEGGDMKIVFWGTDQDHEPYDFSTTIAFKYH